MKQQRHDNHRDNSGLSSNLLGFRANKNEAAASDGWRVVGSAPMIQLELCYTLDVAARLQRSFSTALQYEVSSRDGTVVLLGGSLSLHVHGQPPLRVRVEPSQH